MDGGTTSLRVADEAGREHGVLLVQHAFPQAGRSLDAIPGRLYFDGRLVPMRSAMESRLLRLLRAAEVACADGPHAAWDRSRLSPNALVLGDDLRAVMSRTPEDNTRALADQVVRLVESEEYVRFADRVEMAADPTVYDVWVVWDAATRNRVTVKLAGVLGTGLAATRAFLDEARPLKDGLAALQVADQVAWYHAAGVPVRVEPAFRWKLP